MKKAVWLILTLGLSICLYAQDKLEVSTLRVGGYKIFMSAEEADAINGKTIQRPTSIDNESVVTFQGESIKLTLTDKYDDAGNKTGYQVYHLSSYSKKLKTKSGMGVGSSRDELISAYKNYPNFNVSQGWDDDGKILAKESYFTLSDYDAGTYLTFRLVNNIVVEVIVGVDEGC